jgi:DNA-binding transcriptional MerR regulator
MRQTSKVEGTKIAQAAKDLNVTSVTIRRYLSEFNIETTTDENGIKVLPDQAMEELKTVRRLKEDGLTNPKVMEMLEESRVKRPSAPKAKAKESAPSRVAKSKVVEDVEEEEVVEAPKVDKRKGPRRLKVEEAEVIAEAPAEDANEEDESPAAEGPGGDAPGDKPKHSLTCQTCGKVFEHMNPRLRDCLDCYRTKRKERRRGGSERHKNVIQHPIAQQAVNKAQQQNHQASNYQNGSNGDNNISVVTPLPVAPQPVQHYTPPAHTQERPAPVMVQSAAITRGPVRNYRKAIEETRQITGSLKRRLERPDLPEGDRRWLEQIYAYQLILHQGWRHLSDYKNNTTSQGKQEE